MYIKQYQGYNMFPQKQHLIEPLVSNSAASCWMALVVMIINSAASQKSICYSSMWKVGSMRNIWSIFIKADMKLFCFDLNFDNIITLTTVMNACTINKN